MEFAKNIIEFIFSSALFINACLFIPQAVGIFKQKSANGVSLSTFVGFLLIQLTIVLHGMINHDTFLAVGYLLSMLTCGSVVILILLYKKPKKIISGNEISLKEILDQLPGHIYWKDKEGVCLGCNTNNWKDFKLQSLADFIGKTDYDIFSKEEADRLCAIDQEIIDTAQPKTVEEEITINGEKILYLSHKSPLKNHAGDIVGILGMSINITRAKKESLNKLDFLENIIAVMPGNVYWMNRDEIYMGCNNNQAQAIGLASRKDIIGKRNVEIPGFLIPDVIDKANKTVMMTEKAIIIEEPAILLDGTDAIFLSHKVPLFDSQNNVTGMVGISFDITDRKKAEKQLAEAIQSKSTFLRVVSHEIKGPLSNIFYIANILKDDIENDKFNKNELLEYIETNLKDTERGIEIINFLQKFLNLNEYQTERMVTVNLAKELIDIINIFEENNEKDLSFYLLKDENVSRTVILNRNIFEILKILLGNSVKYSKKKGEIKIRFEHSSKNAKNYLSFSVEDNGSGIHENLLNNLFTPLLNALETQAYNAPAVKLSYAKKLIESLEGTLSIKSDTNYGTQVTVTIPYEKSDQEVYFEMEYLNEKEIAKPFKKKLRFLIIEDNATTAHLLKEEVLKFQHYVDTASNAMDAYEYIKAKHYDVLFMDISLPGINGVEFAKKLRQSIIAQPIMIAVTSHNHEKDIDLFVEQGFATVINKPFTSKDILYCVETIHAALSEE